MKILQVAAKPHRRGAEVFANDLNDWLTQEGHEVFTFYLYHHFGEDCLAPATANTNALAEHHSPLEKVPGFNPRLLWLLCKAIRLFKPDIVQASGGRCLKYCALARRFSACEFRLVYRSIGSPGYWKRGRLGQKIAEFINSQADTIVAVSDATLSEFGPSSTAQIRRRIHRGTPLKSLQEYAPIARENLKTPENAEVLVYIGSLSHEKCPQRAIQILSSLVDAGRNTYLWFLGDGPELSDCRELANKKGIGSRVRFLGTVQQVAPYIKAADLHLLTSDTEGLPGCIVECSGLGVPSIAADVGGVSEIVKHDKTGFLVQPSDIEGYAECARILLTDQDRRISMSRAAQEHSKSFSMSEIGPQYLALYRELLSQ